MTIDAGIYVLVGIAAGQSGMHAPLDFVFAAMLMSFSAASFAELGTLMPVSASEAAYVEKAFGRPCSMTMALLVVLTATISAVTISVGSQSFVKGSLLQVVEASLNLLPAAPAPTGQAGGQEHAAVDQA